MTDVETGASSKRTSLRDAVTTTVSPKLASCSSTGGSSSAAPPTVTSWIVASENPASDTVSAYVPDAFAAQYHRGARQHQPGLVDDAGRRRCR